jgi:hypothetical protein
LSPIVFTDERFFISFKIQVLAGNTAILSNPFLKKCLSLLKKGYLNQRKRLQQCCSTPFHSHFKKKAYFTFKKKLISTKEKAFLHNQKRFSHEKKGIKRKEKKCFSTHRSIVIVIFTYLQQFVISVFLSEYGSKVTA